MRLNSDWCRAGMFNSWVMSLNTPNVSEEWDGMVLRCCLVHRRKMLRSPCPYLCCAIFFNWREMNKETTPSRCGLLIFWVYLVLLTRVCETYGWLQHSRKKIIFPVAIINPWRGVGIWEPLYAAEIKSNRKGVTQNLSRCLWRGPFFAKQSLPLPSIWQPWWFSPT